MKSVLVAATAAMALGVAGRAAAADNKCQLVKILEVPVTMEGLEPTVAAAVNGHETRFMIDTGAFFSIMSADAAQQFGLKKSVAPFGLSIKGLGGATRAAEAVRADEFSFAGAGFKNIQFLVGGRVGGGDISGVIGQNIMGPFDVEYDFANGVMRFFKAKDCGDANLAYWSAGKALSRVNIEEQGQYVQSVLIKAQVNGQSIRVKVDSGASVSYLNRRQAQYAGVRIDDASVTAGGISYGVYGGGVETYLAPFASFKVGDEEIKNTQLRVADIGLGDGQGEMLLGADFFLSHRILISNAQKKFYFTYNGGPVFRLDRNGGRQAQGGSPPAAATPAPTAQAANTPPAGNATAGPAMTPAEYARKAAAEAARREYAEAIADYSRAIELDPKDGAAYRARARLRLSNRQPLLGVADLDEAIKLKPDDLEALMLRGEVFLNNKDTARAQADFEAAQKTAPANADLSAQIGLAYTRAGFYDEGLKRLDAWIAAHPRSEDLGRALASRCWARVAQGKALEAALADCDQSLKRDRNSETMSYRGLALYRMGRVDEAIAQFAVALKAQPRLAPALYGRGLAELKKGDKAAGEADLAAAAAILPGMVQQFRRYGLAPEGAPAAARPAG